MTFNRICSSLLALAIGAGVCPAFAGSRIVVPVAINDSAHYAEGTIVDARASTDGNQMIGCLFGTTAATCFAITASGASKVCSTSDVNQLNAIRAIEPESMIRFYWNTDGTCSYLLIENSSRVKPAATTGY